MWGTGQLGAFGFILEIRQKWTEVEGAGSDRVSEVRGGMLVETWLMGGGGVADDWLREVATCKCSAGEFIVVTEGRAIEAARRAPAPLSQLQLLHMEREGKWQEGRRWQPWRWPPAAAAPAPAASP